MKWLVCSVLAVGCVFNVHAYNFTPTQDEFHSWDDRCKKAYSFTSPGRGSGYYKNLSKTQIEEARQFGEAAGGAWHYCAGVIWLQRAVSNTDKKREHDLKRAESEIRFTYSRIPADNDWYPEIHIDYAKVNFLLGKKVDAFAILNRLVNSHPTHSLPYTALAYYLKQEGQLSDAISLMQKAPAELLAQSAELNYFLGWYLMEANKLDDAVTYAQKAYGLNYPSPALRQRLAAKGRKW